MSTMISIGFKGLSLRDAGQLSVQRPHSVQLNPSKSCFQLKSSKFRAPKYSGEGGSYSARIVSPASGLLASGITTAFCEASKENLRNFFLPRKSVTPPSSAGFFSTNVTSPSPSGTVNSSTVELSSVSPRSIFRMAPFASRDMKKMFKGAANTWLCLLQGT